MGMPFPPLGRNMLPVKQPGQPGPGGTDGDDTSLPQPFMPGQMRMPPMVPVQQPTADSDMRNGTAGGGEGDGMGWPGGKGAPMQPPGAPPVDPQRQQLIQAMMNRMQPPGGGGGLAGGLANAAAPMAQAFMARQMAGLAQPAQPPPASDAQAGPGQTAGPGGASSGGPLSGLMNNPLIQAILARRAQGQPTTP